MVYALYLLKFTRAKHSLRRGLLFYFSCYRKKPLLIYDFVAGGATNLKNAIRHFLTGYKDLLKNLAHG